MGMEHTLHVRGELDAEGVGAEVKEMFKDGSAAVVERDEGGRSMRYQMVSVSEDHSGLVDSNDLDDYDIVVPSDMMDNMSESEVGEKVMDELNAEGSIVIAMPE